MEDINVKLKRSIENVEEEEEEYYDNNFMKEEEEEEKEYEEKEYAGNNKMAKSVVDVSKITVGKQDLICYWKVFFETLEDDRSFSTRFVMQDMDDEILLDPTVHQDKLNEIRNNLVPKLLDLQLKEMGQQLFKFQFSEKRNESENEYEESLFANRLKKVIHMFTNKSLVLKLLSVNNTYQFLLSSRHFSDIWRNYSTILLDEMTKQFPESSKSIKTEYETKNQRIKEDKYGGSEKWIVFCTLLLRKKNLTTKHKQ